MLTDESAISTVSGMRTEKITKEIIELKKEVGRNVWEIGHKLNEVKNENLFLEKQPTFEEYLEKEVEFGRTSAYNFMKIANAFDVQLVEFWGVKKLDLLLTVKEPKKRAEIMKEGPKPFSELKESVKESRVLGRAAHKPNDFFNHAFNLEAGLNKALALLGSVQGELTNVEAYWELVQKSPEWAAYKRQGELLALRSELFKKIGALR